VNTQLQLTGLLDDLYATLTPHKPTACDGYTALVLDTVHATLPGSEWLTYPDALRAFVQLHHDDLAALVRDFGPCSGFAGSWPYELVRYSVVIAVCERLRVKPLWLELSWDERFESDTALNDVRDAWGTGW
jgi:hypothetical protein